MDHIIEESKPRLLGALLKDSFHLTIGNLKQTLVISFCGVLPSVFLLSLVAASAGVSTQEEAMALITSGRYSLLAAVALAVLASKAIESLSYLAMGVYIDTALRGEKLGLADVYSHAASYFWPFLWTAILTSLFIFGGLLLLIIPGIIMLIRYSFVNLTVILENENGRGAMRRSSEIVRAHMKKVLGNLICLLLIAIPILFVLAMIFGLIEYMIPSGGFISRFITSTIHSIPSELVKIWILSFQIMLYRDLSALHPRA